MPEWLDLLQSRVNETGSITLVAREIGYSRPTVSLALKGKYPGGTAKLEARVLDRLARKVNCPYLSQSISQEACGDYASRPMPTSDPRSYRHWSACQACLSNVKGEGNDQQ